MTAITVTVEPDARAPRVSRGYLDEFRADLEPRFNDVALVLSELVTNSVRHGGAVAQISVEVQTSETLIRIEVTDRGPCFSELDPRHGGMGLDIVDRLADRWGVVADDGCTVWAEISKHMPGPTDHTE